MYLLECFLVKKIIKAGARVQWLQFLLCIWPTWVCSPAFHVVSWACQESFLITRAISETWINFMWPPNKNELNKLLLFNCVNEKHKEKMQQKFKIILVSCKEVFQFSVLIWENTVCFCSSGLQVQEYVFIVYSMTLFLYLPHMHDAIWHLTFSFCISLMISNKSVLNRFSYAFRSFA